jgi:hypothetical protein
MSQAPPLNGQIIGQTERATRALLDGLLARTDTRFDVWVSLNLVANADEELSSEAVTEQLVAGLYLSGADAKATLDEARQADLLTTTDPVRLTDAGRARYQQIKDGTVEIAERLYGDLPHDDLVTVSRVLETVTTRARALAGR